MAFFYDVHNPILREFFSGMSGLEELRVEISNALPDIDLDILRIFDADREKKSESLCLTE